MLTFSYTLLVTGGKTSGIPFPFISSCGVDIGLNRI